MATSSTDKSPKKTELQQFEMVEMSRSELTAAPYNPRKISDVAKKRLRDNIKRVGLLAPIVLNKRTGNIVSGHQRIAIMDSLERNNTYRLDVSVVDLDEKTEKEQNLFFNNEFAQGSWDVSKLDDMMKEIDFKMAGFDAAEMSIMLPSFEPPRSEAEAGQLSTVKKTAEDIKGLKKARKEAIAKTIAAHPEDQSVEFFLVLVFRDEKATDEFLDIAKYDRGEKYLDGRAVTDLLKASQGKTAE